jgi:hypothetical protein
MNILSPSSGLQYVPPKSWCVTTQTNTIHLREHYIPRSLNISGGGTFLCANYKITMFRKLHHECLLVKKRGWKMAVNISAAYYAWPPVLTVAQPEGTADMSTVVFHCFYLKTEA